MCDCQRVITQVKVTREATTIFISRAVDFQNFLSTPI